MKFDLTIFCRRGDGWTIPVAGAVLFGLVACALPLGPGGCPIITLDNRPRILRLKTLELGEEGGSDSEESPQFQVTGPARHTCVDDTETSSWHILPSDESSSWHISSDEDADAKEEKGGVLVFLVEPDKPEELCKTCDSCGSLIGPGTCLISWQGNENGTVFNLHSACCSNFAVSSGIATAMMMALVENQPFVKERLHGIVNLVVHELLDMTRGAHEELMKQKVWKHTAHADANGCFFFHDGGEEACGVDGRTFPDTVPVDSGAGLPPTVPASPSALPTIPALLEENGVPDSTFEESQAFAE